MIVGLVAIFSISLTDLGGAVFAVNASLYAFLGATIAVLIGSFLLGAGLLVYPGGVDALAWTEPMTGRTLRVAPGTRTKAKAAGALSIVYGVQGILAVYILVEFLTAATGLELTRLQGLYQLLFLNWIVAAILLVAASAVMGSFLSSLRRDIASAESVGTVGFVVYSIINAIGVLFLAGPLLMAASSPTFGSFGLVIFVAIGALMELLVVPIIGIVGFSLMIPTGLRMRRIAGGTAAIAVPAYPVYAAVPMYASASYVPAELRGVPANRGATARAASLPIEDIPPPPPDETLPGTDSEKAGESWVLRLEAEIRELERSVAEQRQSLLDAERALMAGRIDNASYETVTRDGRERIVECERQITERRARLSAGPWENPPG